MKLPSSWWYTTSCYHAGHLSSPVEDHPTSSGLSLAKCLALGAPGVVALTYQILRDQPFPVISQNNCLHSQCLTRNGSDGCSSETTNTALFPSFKSSMQRIQTIFLNHKFMTHGGSDDILFCGKWDYSQILTEERNLSPARETSE